MKIKKIEKLGFHSLRNSLNRNSYEMNGKIKLLITIPWISKCQFQWWKCCYKQSRLNKGFLSSSLFFYKKNYSFLRKLLTLNLKTQFNQDEMIQSSPCRYGFMQHGKIFFYFKKMTWGNLLCYPPYLHFKNEPSNLHNYCNALLKSYESKLEM
jgi:hypothetical protein